MCCFTVQAIVSFLLFSNQTYFTACTRVNFTGFRSHSLHVGSGFLTVKPTSTASEAKTACLFSWSFAPLAVFFFSLHLIPPDENLIDHFKASALGLTTLDLTVSDLLLVLWSLRQSLKGPLQPSSSNPLCRVQLDQKGNTI